MARFNRHRPALCADCAKPLSVRERRASMAVENDMLCAWDEYQRLRRDFEGSYWISQSSYEALGTNPANSTAKVFNITADDLFGQKADSP